MPTLSDLRNRYSSQPTISNMTVNGAEAEALVFDGRSQLTPKQQVESKLRRALTQMEERAMQHGAAMVGR